MPSHRTKRLAVGVLFAASLSAGSFLRAEETPVTLTLDKPGPPISPYLYGQFIEHLGRCIHDGIWAEKLWDRKFLKPPLNPWDAKKPAGPTFWKGLRPDGAAADVFLDAAGAYVGDHGMAVRVVDSKGGRCGIVQGGLGVVEGAEVVGYAVLAHAAAERGAEKGAAGPAQKAGAVEVRLAWGHGAADGQSVRIEGVGPAYRTFSFRFKAGATTDAASLSVTIDQPGRLRIGCVSLMPADHVNGMRADTLALVRRLNAPITRWPGGNFVSGYRWKDAIGERDRRPPRWERAWNDVEDNDFGLDEFMAYCEAVKTEPYIAVNTGLGSSEDAADEVEYANGSERTRWGAERAKNGRAAPYRVTWWGIGNEMYGNWQLGNVPVDRYAARHNDFVRAMRLRDPAIRVIAVGAPGRWNDAMLPVTAAHMDLLSGHYYTERKLKVPFTPGDATKYAGGFAAYSGRVAGGVRGLVQDIRKRHGKGDAAIDRVMLAVDEWGIVRDWNAAPDDPGVGSFEHYYTLGDAIAVARAMHELLRSADVVAMANWAQAVNALGTIKTSRTRAALDPAGHVLALYRAQVGGALVRATVPAGSPVDAVAAVDRAAGTLAIGLVNASPDSPATVVIQAGGAAPTAAIGWRIDGPALGSINVPGQPEAVTTAELGQVALDRPVVLPPRSITVLKRR
jgi:alpha-N-arabinofuranosidase